MKMNVSNVFLILFLLAAVACGKKTESASATAGEEEWPSMDAFHMIMAEAYHPYKDSANVEPARRIAGEMAQAAEDWQKQSLPDKVNTEEVKAQLAQLATGARALSDRIKAGASDEEIGTALTALHDNFHAITEAFHGSMEKHEH